MMTCTSADAQEGHDSGEPILYTEKRVRKLIAEHPPADYAEFVESKFYADAMAPADGGPQKFDVWPVLAWLGY